MSSPTAAEEKARRPSTNLSVVPPHVTTVIPPASPMVASSTLRKTFGGVGNKKNRKLSVRHHASKRDASQFSAAFHTSNKSYASGNGSSASTAHVLSSSPTAGGGEHKVEHDEMNKRGRSIPNDDVDKLTEQFQSRRHSVTNNLHQAQIQAAALAAASAAVTAAGGVAAGDVDMATGAGIPKHVAFDENEDEDSSMDGHIQRVGLGMGMAHMNTGAWSKEEDEKLRTLQTRFGANNWKDVSDAMVGRSRTQCLTRWNKFLRPDIRKGQWTNEEDALLVQLVQEVPKKNWGDVAIMIKGRSAKQCRERWCYNLDPSINKNAWTGHEDAILMKEQAERGNRWAHIATMLPGRTENAVKTRFKSIMRAKKREWHQDEDDLIMSMHQQLGSRWEAIAGKLKNRTKNAVKTRYRALAKGSATAPPVPGAPNQTLGGVKSGSSRSKKAGSFPAAEVKAHGNSQATSGFPAQLQSYQPSPSQAGLGMQGLNNDQHAAAAAAVAVQSKQQQQQQHQQQEQQRQHQMQKQQQQQQHQYPFLQNPNQHHNSAHPPPHPYGFHPNQSMGGPGGALGLGGYESLLSEILDPMGSDPDALLASLDNNSHYHNTHHAASFPGSDPSSLGFPWHQGQNSSMKPNNSGNRHAPGMMNMPQQFSQQPARRRSAMASNGVAVDEVGSRMLQMQHKQHGMQNQQQRRMSSLSHMGGNVQDHRRGSGIFGVNDVGLDLHHPHHQHISGMDSSGAPTAPPVDEDLIEFLDAWNQGPLES